MSRGVQVFGFVVSEHAATKGNDSPTLVLYREHDPLTKAVVGAPLVVGDQHARFFEQFLSGLIFTISLHQVVPARWCKADPKVAGNLAREAAAFQVIHDFVALRVLSQGVLVELARVLEASYSGLFLSFGGSRPPGVIFGYFQAQGLRKALDCLAEIEPFVFHHKPQGVPAGPAAKAVIELSLGVYRKGWRFLVVKRAAGAVVFACLLELHSAIDDLDNIEATQ